MTKKWIGAFVIGATAGFLWLSLGVVTGATATAGTLIAERHSDR